MAARYALYYAPDIDSDLWRRATHWVGRDAATGKDLITPTEIGVDASQLQELTSSPRRYGIHATLKPPMYLAEGYSFQELLERVGSFCAEQTPVTIGELKPVLVHGFLALVPVVQSDELQDFAASCIKNFDDLRAPMDAQMRAKRLEAGLTPREIELLDTYGYPYIFEFFRWHITLSNKLDAEFQNAMLDAAQTWFAPALANPIKISGLSIYKEEAPGAPFSRVVDVPFGG